MASRRPTKKKGRGRRPSAFSDVLRLPRLPHFDEQQLDLIGLGLVALAAFFAFVFYLGWNGGRVGETLGDGFIYLFGGVGYLVPIAMFGAGAVLVLRQVLPSVRPFKFGTDILFLFLMTAGVLLLTGASLAGLVRATGESLTTTTRRVRQSTHEFAAIVSKKPPTEPIPVRPLEEDKPPEVEPVVRATHVEAPALDGERRFPDLYGHDEDDTIDESEVEQVESEIGDDVAAGVAAVRKD